MAMPPPPSEPAMNELQRVQLCAQILVCGHFLQGTVPDEPLMVGAFSDTTSTGLEQGSGNDGKHVWEKAWIAASKQVLEESTPDQAAQGGAVQITPRFVESMPTATRTSLAAAFQSEKHHLEDSRERKKIRQSDYDDDQDQDPEQELRIEKIRKQAESADAVVASIQEHREALHPLLQDQGHEQAPVAAVVLAFEAAASAAKAAAVAAAAAYDAASRARAAVDRNERESESDHRPDLDQVSRIVFKAVSQVQTAMEIDNPSRVRARNQTANQVDPSILTEGTNVEVLSGDPEGWLTAKVLNVKDGMVLVAYHEVFDDSKNHVTEWLHVKPDYRKHPRVRNPYPSFDLNETHNEAPRAWTAGDRVDVRVGHTWREGLVIWAGNDELIVFYLNDGALGSVRLRDLRPSLIWRGNKWTLWKDQLPKESIKEIEVEITGDVGETGPSPNHKMRKLIDVILEENETQRRRDDESRSRRQQKRNGDAKNYSKVASSKVSKARKLIEKASKVNLQVSGPRLTRQFVGKISPAAAAAAAAASAAAADSASSDSEDELGGAAAAAAAADSGSEQD